MFLQENLVLDNKQCIFVTMSKIEEIINHYVPPICQGDWYKEMMKEYAEYYAKKCLKIAAENAKLSVDNWVHPKGYPYLMVNQNPNRLEEENYFHVDQNSITNIQLPEHD